MNEADLEALARQGLGQALANGWKPQTLETNAWMRLRALELAVQWRVGLTQEAYLGSNWTTMIAADEFLKFLKGEST